jgi:hypothetical protein
MFTFDSGAQDLTKEEQILHHHAAVIKKDLEAYHTYPRTQEGWNASFKNHLVLFILVIQFVQPFSDFPRRNR